MKRSILSGLGVRVLLAAVAVCGASAARAEAVGSGAYFGLSAGQTMLPDYCESAPGLVVTTCDDEDTGYRIFGGYKFHTNLAVEGAYVNFGAFPATGSYLGLPFGVETELTGFTAHAVGMIPLGDRFTLLGRAGAIFWNMDSSAQVFGFSGSESESGADIALGIGGQFNFTPNFGLRADFDLYPDLGNDDTGEADVTMVSVGLVFSF